MKPWLHTLEKFVDKSIPYLVVVLLILIIGEFTKYELINKYDYEVLLIDYFIVIVFVIDLCFKYYRIRDYKLFIKKYWLDILAVFPFFLLFRLIEEIALFFSISSFGESQKLLHTSLELGRISEEASQEARVLREIQEATKLERTTLFARILRPLERIPRILKAFHFYEKPYKKKSKTT